MPERHARGTGRNLRSRYTHGSDETVAKLKQGRVRELVEAHRALKFGYFARTVTRVRFTRAEGPAVNSHARKGVVCATDELEGRRPGTAIVPHLRRSFLDVKAFPALRPGLFTVGPLGLPSWDSFSEKVAIRFATVSDDPCHRSNFHIFLRAGLLPDGPPGLNQNRPVEARKERRADA